MALPNELYQLFYKNIEIIDIVDKIIHYFRTQNYDKAIRTSTQLINVLEPNMTLIQNIAGQERFLLLNNILIHLFQTQSSKDYICIILATSTVLRKLLTAGIIPDYFIVIDANERVYKHISGYENNQVPMLYLSTAYHGFARNYHGKKYIILQRDFDKSEEFAKEHGMMLNYTGGSVSTTALDVGISLGCKRIIFLGLDLAFPNNFVHAEGTSHRQLTTTDDLRQVEDVQGNMIYTSRNLDMYRRWIEDRISNEEKIEFIDATEGGAKIKRMKIMTMQECIANFSSIAD